MINQFFVRPGVIARIEGGPCGPYLSRADSQNILDFSVRVLDTLTNLNIINQSDLWRPPIIFASANVSTTIRE